MKLITAFVFFLCSSSLIAEPLSVSTSAESALLINADTGAVLYQKKPHAKLYPASITKIATAAYALKLTKGDLSQEVVTEQECIGSVSEEAKRRVNYTLPSYWLVTDCSHMGIKKGEKLSLRDLMFGMMVASADDASNIIAYTLANGNIPTFMEGLNRYLKELGCTDTNFNNPHGLHHPEHMTSAFDMAIITREAIKNPKFREIVMTTRFTRPKTNKQEPTTLLQTNRLLRAGEFYYPRAIGVKTGYTSKAGNTFVGAAKDGERTLIVVLMNVKERKDMFRDSIRLFDAAFNQPKVEKVLVKAGPQKYSLEIEGAESTVETYVAENLSLSYYPAEAPKVKALLQWDKVTPPIAQGQKVGEIQIYQEGISEVKAAPLLAQKAVDATIAHRIRELFFGKESHLMLWIGLGAILYCLFYAFRRR